MTPRHPGAIDDLLPNERTPLLVTSRFPTWRQFTSEVAVECMTEREAVEFLQKRAKTLDQTSATVFATVLGRLPLALDHSAAYCRFVGVSFRDYASVATKLINVLPENTTYSRSVAATFELAIDAAAGRCPDADRLIAYLAHCAPEQIPEALIEGDIANVFGARSSPSEHNNYVVRYAVGKSLAEAYVTIPRLTTLASTLVMEFFGRPAV